MSRSYVETVLLNGEELEYAGTLHWVIFLPGFSSTIFGAILCMLTPQVLNETFMLGLLAEMHGYLLWTGVSLVLGGVGMIAHSYLRFVSTELAVTNRRVIAKTGFISRSTFEVMLNRVEGANIDQTVWGRILGFGSIYVHGTGGGITPIDHIADPLSFKKQLMVWVERNQPTTAANGAQRHSVAEAGN
ncbi:MAG: PH domain-containing protein [Alphaproteobacteria bacterium]|nr:PH domain-containing protein [Alphaproteobacteria bacterium]